MFCVIINCNSKTTVVISTKEDISRAIKGFLMNMFDCSESELSFSFTPRGENIGTFRFNDITGTYHISEVITC